MKNINQKIMNNNISLIGISGKIGSGKDTIGMIIQYLYDIKNFNYTHSPNESDFQSYINNEWNKQCSFQIKKFAYKLKQIVSIITGISIEDLEKEEVKNSYLGEEWKIKPYNWIYEGMIGFENIDSSNIETNKDGSLRLNVYDKTFKVRELLQDLGTNVCRKIHEDFWINSLFVDYKKLIRNIDWSTQKKANKCLSEAKYPNWIITDVRFPNEAKAIKDRGGIIIRVNRNTSVTYEQLKAKYPKLNWDEAEEISPEDLVAASDLYDKTITVHPSETALDEYTFDYTIDNNGTIDELIKKVKEILIKENII